MQNKKWIIIGGALLLLAGLPVIWYLASPLFIDNTVDEAFPFEMPAAAAMAGMSDEEKMALEAEFLAAVPDEATIEQLPETERLALEQEVQTAAAAVMPDHEMDETLTAAEWLAGLSGEFSGADDFHQGSGTAVIYEQGSERILRFENFEVTNGPDLHVILSKHPNPASHEDVGEDYVDLGSIKGNIGNQNYDIPAGVDLSEYQSVVIYCVPFHVVFATAPLAP